MSTSFLSQGDINACRETISHVLPGTAVISTRSYVSDGGGGGTTSWVASGTVACRLDPMSGYGREGVVGERLAPDANYILTLPAETSVNTDSRIRVSSVDYEVLAIRAPLSWELSRRVEVNKVV